MSADNWRKCSKCEAENDRLIGVSLSELTAAYGKVPVEEYERLKEVHYELVRTVIPETFREDYEIYTQEDTLYMRYRGVCKACGASFKFEHEVDMEIK